MGPFCHDGDFRRGIPDLASDRGLDHCGLGEVSADSLHSGSCSWRITPEPFVGLEVHLWLTLGVPFFSQSPPC